MSESFWAAVMISGGIALTGLVIYLIGEAVKDDDSEEYGDDV